jgi:CheY-like chemotaxis protein
VVLLDLRLAGDADCDLSGWKVLDQLVLDPATRDIPVVLTSGAVSAIEARRPAPLADRGVRVLIKPYDLDQLLATVRELCPCSSGTP